MKDRFILFRRGGVFYFQDRTTGQQKSLRTGDKTEARKQIQAKNDTVSQPMMNLIMARTYLAAQDPKLITRTWAEVMDLHSQRGKPPTRDRQARAMRTKPMRYLRPKRLVETTADDFFHAFSIGTNSTVGFLQTLHNEALGMGWIPGPILPRKLWPKVQKKIRRAVTEEEHRALVGAANEPEWKLYLQLLWFTGASQTDAANLTTGNLDWERRVLTYHRAKLEGRELPPARLAIGTGLEAVLKQLPQEGALFPKICQFDDRARACTFWKLCKRLKFEGISLHSYRYAWAERAKVIGMPQRWAQAALGHNSKAVHEAYARNAVVVCPPIDGAVTWNAASQPVAETNQNQPPAGMPNVAWVD
jgi:integrase